MTRKFSFFLVALSILLFACKNNDGPDTTNDSIQSTHTLVHDDEAREYILYVPSVSLL